MSGPEDRNADPKRIGNATHALAVSGDSLVGPAKSATSDTGPSSGQVSLRALLAGYDREVEDSLRRALEARTGLDRVRILHNAVRRSISVHDAVLEAALCPQLDDLPGGQPIADRLRRGCQERAALLVRLDAISHNVAAANVYRFSAEEVEEILEGLDVSFAAHATDETTEVERVLEAAAASTNPDAVAARMAIEAEHAPTRAHAATVKHPRSVVLKTIYRYGDRFHDWSDSHRGWSDPRAARKSVRAEQVDLLKNQRTVTPPTIRDVLAGYDMAVESVIAELEAARSDLERADALGRLSAAIAVHDYVLGGVLCPLLEAVAGGDPLAARLREGCHRRAELQESWHVLAKGVKRDDLARLSSPEVEAIIGPLVESFRSHEKQESTEVIALLDQLPDSSYRTKTSGINDIMWPWYSEGPEVLALHMALWAQLSPTRIHPLLARHPTSRVLRAVFHQIDDLRDHWGDTTVGGWLFPKPPERPLAGRRPPGESADVVSLPNPR